MMFFSSSEPAVDKAQLVKDNATNVDTPAASKETAGVKDRKDNDATQSGDGRRRGGRCCKGGGKCCAGKCVGMAIVGLPVAVVLSPIIVPTLLVRRAIYGPMKCGKRCKKATEDAAEDKAKADEEELPKADRT